jgi:Transposase, Mutator family
VLRTYQRRTLSADALIAGCYLVGTNARRVQRALATADSGRHRGARAARPQSDRDLAARRHRRSCRWPEGPARRQGHGGESAEAWRAVLDDLIRRGLRRPEFLIVDGAPGLENAIAAVWDGVPVQRCPVHKHRNLLAHAPERLHEEITADYNDMIYAATREEIEARRKAFIRKWRLKHRAVADSLQEAGDRCSASRGCRRASGAAFASPMPSSGCTRSSNAGSKPRPFCHRPTPQPCCSGRCFSQLTSQPDQIASRRWRARRANPNHIPVDTGCRFAIHSLGQVLY